MPDIEKYNDQTFEHYKQINEFGGDFWYARDLQKILQYKEWRNFKRVIDKAKVACKSSGMEVADHFVEFNKMTDLAKATKRQIDDFMLSRYACYLIVQNADPRKKIVALGQTYFAFQARKQELQKQFETLDEDKKRLAIREELREHNKSLARTAKNAGVETSIDYAIFQNHGYRGLYDGLGAKEIRQRKGLQKGQQILDYMGSTELAANLFRATQTDEKLKRENIQGKENANQTHFEVGAKVRQTIQELGGTMPEDLPTPGTSIQEIEKLEQKKRLADRKKK
ncbi:DNA damage-inducible protein D [Rummeliibacillus suwonensis]|jgi:DNA-damage-inducible protein D|uniref:DNA damage-inducible protein D n=1 Tax=Rummeliibacillus suwonensis TaxID=1306154 RepID=UPI0011B82A9B|nr:DNA damage-inducible protein D [Rummeliibacillus suwonensis]